MKRTITTLLTVALVASLLLGGFAGSAAAAQQDADGHLWQGQDVTQVSTSNQDTAVAYGSTATAEQSTTQSNDNSQDGQVTAENTFENNVFIISF